MTPTECRKAIQEKRERRAEIQARIADATGKEKLSLRLEDARLAEDINTLARCLRDLMPQHHIRKSGGWSKLEAMTWNEIGLKTWRELEAETNSEEIAMMAKAARETMTELSNVLTGKQSDYFSAVGETMEPYQRGKRTQADVSAEYSVDCTTVSRTVGKARKRIQDDARKRYFALKNACKDGARLDVSDEETMKVLLSTLTERQLLYMVLYYGNWMSTREVGECLGVDHSTVSRTIARGLERLSEFVSNREVEVSGVPALEMRIMEHLNAIPPETKRVRQWKLWRKYNRKSRHVSDRTLYFGRNMFLTLREKGTLGVLLREKRGLGALVIRAIAALKRKLRR